MVEVKGLKKYFPVRKKSLFAEPGMIRAIDDVSFSIKEGKTLGLVGESGSGKTTVARSLLRLIEPDEGKIIINKTEINNLKKPDLRKFRKNMQLVFQDPYNSLNPRMTIGKIISEPLRIHSEKNIDTRLNDLIKLVGLKEEHLNRYPHEFSGGQRQRIGIARAISINPKFIILDEPVSALDVSIQGQILNLLKDLQEKFNLTYLFVAHDLAVVEHMSDDIAVMYLGRIVEKSPRKDLYEKALHPYTKSLLSSIPKISPEKHGFKTLTGEIPSPENPPPGCHFYPRCEFAMEICKTEYPAMKKVGNTEVSCHLY